MNKYKIIYELGKGHNGVAYLAEKDHVKYIIKRQKLLPKELKPNFKFSFWREIDFNTFVNALPKNQQLYFMKMYSYEIIKCKYEHYNDSNIKRS